MTLVYRIADAKYVVRKLMLWIADLWVCRPGVAPPDECRVLIIKPDHIGDFVMWLPVARAIRESYPRTRFHLTLLANGSLVEFARSFGLFDEIWGMDRERMDRDFAYRAQMISNARKTGFGVAINALYTREFTRGDLVVRATRAPVAIGYRADPEGRDYAFNRIADRWYSHIVTFSTPRMHETERNREFVRKAFGKPIAYVPPWLDLPAPGVSLKPTSTYAILSPGSSDVRRNWPVERFAEIGRRLRARTGWTLVLCGGRSEMALSTRLAEAIGQDGVVDLTGRSSLVQLNELVRGASLVIANDTSLAHFAAASGAPGVAIVGGGHWNRFLPYPPTADDRFRSTAVTKPMDCFGCRWRCKYELVGNGVFRCIDEIDLDAAWTEVEDVIRRSEAGKLENPAATTDARKEDS